MFSRWTVMNITSASVTTFLAFLAGIISWSVYCACHDIRYPYSEVTVLSVTSIRQRPVVDKFNIY
jgi:uncharacterized membrane protein